MQKLYRGPALHTLVGNVCRSQGATAFSVLAALTAAAIRHRGGPRTIALFTPVSTRQRSGFGSAAGCFVHDRPVVCHIDPAQALSDCFKSVMGQNLAALRFPALSVADLACAVPPLGAALLSDGIDYVQLHVGMPAEAAADPTAATRSDDATGPVPAPDEREPRALGPFRPALDLSVTTLRFEFTPEATTARAFCGAHPAGWPWPRTSPTTCWRCWPACRATQRAQSRPWSRARCRGESAGALRAQRFRSVGKA
ncbi:hypothetical protein [Streptomyces sp. NPDC048295]|uniref:hypothetical protein n=1 Tax=Streptomyces sp. NPDC048295 TaxID=3154617 RepID=UPI003416C54E